MNIDLHEISIREIVNGYVDNNEEGVKGYGGKLNIRPKYQREFVYKDKQRNDVLCTIKKNFPLNVMYWVDNEDGTYEILDGQQRTLSFCQYVNGDYSINNKYFHNLTQTEKDAILDYKCMVYFCKGNDCEKLEWFKTINISGEPLSAQELRNAVYTGTWLTHAKSLFSKTNCSAYALAKKYVTGSPLRQDILETAIKWISDGHIEDYMAKHQHDQNADELFVYFRSVIEWVEKVFIKYRKEMRDVDWGNLYNDYHNIIVNSVVLEDKISKLMLDDDVSNKKGIYRYVFTNDEHDLNIRTFSEAQKRVAYEKQHGICAICGKYFDIEKMEGDHITPWVEGGHTNQENCQMLCRSCNRHKSQK